MKKTLAIAGALLTLSVGAGNLLPAGDFNEGLKGWRSFNPEHKTYYKVENGALVFSGKGMNNKTIAAYYRIGTPLEVGKNYVISANVKANAAAAKNKFVNIYIRYTDAKGKTITYLGPTVDLSNPDVREYSAICKTPAGAVHSQAYLMMRNLGEGETVTIDDIKFFPVEELKAAPGNLVVNGDFEYPILEPWFTSRGVLKRSYTYIVNDGGKRVLAMTGDKKYSNISLLQKIAPLDVNKKYTFSGKVKFLKLKADPAKKFQFRVRSFDSKNRTLTYAERYVKMDNSDWQTVEFTFKPHAQSKGNQVYICTTGFKVGDVVLIDDIVLSLAE